MESIYKIILEDTLAGYWDWNIPENTEYLSPTFKSMFGYEDDELENSPETWQKLIFQDDLQKVLKNFDEHVESKGAVPYKNEVRYKHKNGSTVWVLCTGRVIEWDDAKPIRMVGCHIDITAQKKAEDELLSAQLFLSKTNEVAQIGAWEVDLVENKVLWTPITRDIHEVDSNYTPNVEEGINFYKKGYSRKKIAEVFGQLVASGVAFDEELQIVTAKGNDKWIRTIGHAEFLNGKSIKAFGTFQDIDVQRRMRDELEQSEQRFRESFENSAIGMALVSLEGTWLQVNKQICEITGYSKKELITKTFQEITHPDDLELDLTNVQMLLEGRIDNYQMEKRYIHKYGYHVWVLLSVSLVRSSVGDPVHFVSQIEDITEKKNAQEQLEKVNKDLNGLFESITQVSVIATDYNGIIKHFSKGSETLLGYAASEMVDKSSPAIIHVADEVIARGEELSKEFNRKIEGFDVFVTYAKEGKYESREWTYVRKDGSSFTVQLVVTAIKDTKGNINGFLGIATDISDLKESEENLRQTIDIVSEQNTRLFNFAHIVSHNLKSHTGNLDLLLTLYDDSKDKDEKEELLKHLRSVSHNLNETITHLNEVVSIQTNINNQRNELNLYTYIENTLEILAGEINHTNTSFDIHVPKNTTINYNEAYMESILLNLISNGIKYRSKDRNPHITINYSKTDNKQILEITDNGIGINLDRHGKKIFGMYKTFHGNEDAKGIGLFITKNQVEAMGGKINVTSTPNEGTTFTVYL